jgi:hypothetical protein
LIQGHFCIVSSPCVNDIINQSLQDDAIDMSLFFREKGFLEHPWTSEHGILLGNSPDRSIHNINSFKRKIAEMGGLNHQKEVIIFYTGHGQNPTGNWQINPEDNIKNYLSFDDFFGVWQSCDEARNLKLTLIMDSCYAGEWVARLRDSDMNGFSITIIAASSQKHSCLLSCLTCGQYCCCSDRKWDEAITDGSFVRPLTKPHLIFPERCCYYSTATTSPHINLHGMRNLHRPLLYVPI